MPDGVCTADYGVVRSFGQPKPENVMGEERKYALNWTRLSCHDFDENQVRLQLFTLAYNLPNFMRMGRQPNRNCEESKGWWVMMGGSHRSRGGPLEKAAILCLNSDFVTAVKTKHATRHRLSGKSQSTRGMSKDG